MSEELLLWRDFNSNAELRAVARSVFLGYVVSLAIRVQRIDEPWPR